MELRTSFQAFSGPQTVKPVVSYVVNNLKNHKTSGKENIRAEVLKVEYYKNYANYLTK